MNNSTRSFTVKGASLSLVWELLLWSDANIKFERTTSKVSYNNYTIVFQCDVSDGGILKNKLVKYCERLVKLRGDRQ